MALNKNNTYFEEMRRTLRAFGSKRAEHETRKQQIIDTYGWDSDELKAWYTKKEAMTAPYPTGAYQAYRAWAWSIERCEDELEMEDYVRDNGVKDFVETMQKAGVKTFVFTNQSTAVMENIHAFVKEGCTMEGPCTITRHESRWGDDETEEAIGIRFSLG